MSKKWMEKWSDLNRIETQDIYVFMPGLSNYPFFFIYFPMYWYNTLYAAV